MITVSIVSHNHGKMINKLVNQLLKYQQVKKIIITLNVPENFRIKKNRKILVIKNNIISGFGSNHNTAFKFCKTKFFCVLNPDITFIKNPFSSLICKINKKNLSLISTVIINPKGEIEDSFRYFPNLFLIIKKFFTKFSGTYYIKNSDIYPECIAGMFMLFLSKSFKEVGGFDIKYFMYYEDFDICVRLWKKKLKIMIDITSKIIHDSRMDSRKKLKFFFFHLKSITRFFIKYSFRLPKLPKL